LEDSSKEAPGAFLGLYTDTEELPPSAMAAGRGGRGGRGGGAAARLVVTDVVAGWPAEAAGLRRGDIVAQVDGGPASAITLSQSLANKKAGDKLHLRISRAGPDFEVEATLVGNTARTYKLSTEPQATPAQ